MQQELQLESNCKQKEFFSKFKLEKELQLESNYTQKDLFQNSNWNKFVHLILTLITLLFNDWTSKSFYKWMNLNGEIVSPVPAICLLSNVYHKQRLNFGFGQI